MAGKKTQAQLTPEEKLQQALVPEAEQPYKVPANWCWTKLGNVTKIIGGGTPSTKIKEYYENGNIPWLSPIDLSNYSGIYIKSGAKNITELGLQKSSAKLLPPETVCLSSRAPIGYVVIAANWLCTNQGFKSFLPSMAFISKYLYWFLKNNNEILKRYASGTTFLELSASKAALIEFPISPLAEQQRIVERIESLFAKLDEAKENLQNVLDGFETRKAAILHKAFTGELTANWRKQHGVSMDSWEEKKLLDTCMLKSGNTIPSDAELERIENNAIPYLKVSDMNLPNNLIKITTSSKFAFPINIAHLIPFGSTIFPKRGGAILTNKKRFVSVENILVDLNIMAIIPNNKILVNWYCYYWMQLIDLKTLNNGSNIPQINNKDMAKLNIWLPSLIEQTEIVRIIDNLLAKEQQAHSVVQNALAKIDLIKKSILARAFRGQLATNNPADEPAVKLLERVL